MGTNALWNIIQCPGGMPTRKGESVVRRVRQLKSFHETIFLDLYTLWGFLKLVEYEADIVVYTSK